MRDISIDRTEAEWLVTLLETGDPVFVGTWRRDLAQQIRQQFGMVTMEEELRVRKALHESGMLKQLDYEKERIRSMT